MELVLVVVALALSGCWAGLRLAARARREATTLRRINATLEARAEQCARELQAALAAAEGQADQIKAVHRAKDRRAFASGAVAAAEWVRGRSGLFTLDDVLEG